MAQTLNSAFGDNSNWEQDFNEIQIGYFRQGLENVQTPRDILDQTDVFLRRSAQILGERVLPEAEVYIEKPPADPSLN